MRKKKGKKEKIRKERKKEKKEKKKRQKSPSWWGPGRCLSQGFEPGVVLPRAASFEGVLSRILRGTRKGSFQGSLEELIRDPLKGP